MNHTDEEIDRFYAELLSNHVLRLVPSAEKLMSSDAVFAAFVAAAVVYGRRFMPDNILQARLRALADDLLKFGPRWVN